MNKGKFIIPALVFVLIAGCNIISDNNKDGNQLYIESDPALLNQRIKLVNQNIVLDSADNASQEKMTMHKDRFYHIANIESPTDADGNLLSATSIEIRANKIYVSYHLNENITSGSDLYSGAVDIIDMKNAYNPRILSTVFLDDTDVNALEIEENAKKLWITGGRDVSSSGYETGEHNGAILGELDIDKNELDAGDYKEVPLPSYSGNDIVEAGSNNYLYVSSGATGGGFFKVAKSDLNRVESYNYNFSKSMDKRENDVVGLTISETGEAVFNLIDINSGQVNTFNTGLNISPVDGKNVIEHRAAVTYAALGNAGVKGYRFDDQEPLVYDFNPGETDVANGVTADGQYVYVANGTDGLYIATIAKGTGKSPEAVFNWKGGNGSANFVKTDGRYIILANGTDGLNILKKK